ncbi:DUF1254 domain-containing protein [Kaistia algarum]|uniref:DUF1254 domain-containing protein n=1 Tax=Kaistia algarum TaxID=2083279 RepID=UPI000CE7E377|nr:DUF1254 domain-containing protein [Kaistia algarum]MCX5515759.1 DUF1254 domain-containing protein [Kaistia algarum]PPE80866.1 DUF1254 domain-containing protein [Kaistia algarum]
MKRRTFLQIAAASAIVPILPARAADDLRPLAGQAFLYTYPMVKNYLSLYQYALEPGGSQYKGPLNTLNNVARVFTPADTGVITPNSDTPYSFLVMDLRAEPLVVTLPAIEPGRYYSMQLVDLYTQNVAYLGTRVDGNGGGDFLIAGPSWQGEAPKGVKRVVRLPTDLGLGLIRTQLFGPADIEQVKAIQAGYKVQPLSAYAGTLAPAAAPAVAWPPISDEAMGKDFWALADFLLQFAPPQPWEQEMRTGFGKLGLGAGTTWPPKNLAPETVAMMNDAAKSGTEELRQDVLKLTSSDGLFGTPEEMKGKYLERALGALGGIYGNSSEEALYPVYNVDGNGNVLDATQHNYALRFTKDTLPPVNAFWSITMYDGVTQFLVENPLHRYLINSSMLPDLKPNEQGEIVIYLQRESPGPELESNWLPAPNGRMSVVMRLYLPKPEALDGRWKQPPIEIRS